MKQFVVEVPEKKSPFFLELINNLGYMKTEETDNLFSYDISPAQKQLVRDRIHTAKPSGVLGWDEATKKIKVK